MSSKSTDAGKWVWRFCLIAAVTLCALLLAKAIAQNPSIQEQQEPTVANISLPAPLQSRFEGADDAVRTIALAIFSGAVPSNEAIAALPSGALNTGYAQTAAATFPAMTHTLLREAVVSANAPAAKALIAAGADPFFNAGEMPFLAAQTPSGGRDRAFPDYSDGNAMIEMWLDAGGDPNATWVGAGGELLLTQTRQNNLEGMLLLLARGADPWRQVKIGQTFGDMPAMLSRPFHLKNANANAMANEFAFRLALKGHYRSTPPEWADELDRLYTRTANQYIGSSGSENLHDIWCMQMALDVIYADLGRPMPPAVAELMKMEIPEDTGGFWLAPGEVRSPEDADQIVDNENQTGREKWHGRR